MAISMSHMASCLYQDGSFVASSAVYQWADDRIW